MSVLVLGLNYRNTEVGLLERVAVPVERLPKALADLRGRPHVTEAVVLSTCNRVEVYAHVTRFHGGMADLRHFFAEWGGVPAEDLAEATYDYYDQGAAAHLFAVAGGLDSMVVGERQIALQVKQALVAAEAEGAVGRVLQALFRQSLRVGRLVRSRTGISAGAQSMVDVGLAAAARVLGDLEGRNVLIVGAGKMGGMAAARLRGTAGRLTIANRSADRGERLAMKVDGDVLDFDAVSSGLRDADLVLSSTGAGGTVLDADVVGAALPARAGRPLVLVDLAVPRDVDPSCAALPGVTVLDVDAVRMLTGAGPTGAEVAKAQEIVDGEAARFGAWTRSVRLEPTIAALRTRAEVVRQAELERLSARLSGLDDRQRQTVDALTRGIVNTLLHEPSVRLKAVADTAGGEDYAAALRELFDLPG